FEATNFDDDGSQSNHQDNLSKEGTAETLNASADMPAQSDPLGHLQKELRTLNTKVDQLESSISKKVTDAIYSSVPSLVESIKEKLPLFDAHVQQTLQDQLPNIVVKPMNKQFNAFNTLESRRHGELITIFGVVVKPTLVELLALWLSCSWIYAALAIRQEDSSFFCSDSSLLLLLDIAELCFPDASCELLDASYVQRQEVQLVFLGQRVSGHGSETLEVRDTRGVVVVAIYNHFRQQEWVVKMIFVDLVMSLIGLRGYGIHCLVFYVDIMVLFKSGEQPLAQEISNIEQAPSIPEFVNEENTLVLYASVEKSSEADVSKMTIEQFTEHLTKTTSSIYSSSPPRDESKRKGIAAEEPLKEIMPYMEEEGSKSKMPNLMSFSMPDGRMTNEDVMAQLKEMKRSADLKAEKEKSEQSLKKIMNPATIRAQAQKMAEVEGRKRMVIKEPESGVFLYNENFDLVIQREEEFHLATTPQLARKIIQDNLDVFSQNIGIEGLAECIASASNIRRIQVTDIVKEVEDQFKTYSSAVMDISWYVERIRYGSKESRMWQYSDYPITL
nr:hypothetical protein [Tanacetum cinerariifolium]